MNNMQLRRSPGVHGHRKRVAWSAAALLVVVTGTVQATVQAHAQAAVSRPALTFANGNTGALLGGAYQQALANLLDVNTVRYDPAKFNQSGLLTDSPDTFIRAGGGFTGAVGGDRDGDSVRDATDTCVDQPGSPANGGCPATGAGTGAIKSGGPDPVQRLRACITIATPQ